MGEATKPEISIDLLHFSVWLNQQENKSFNHRMIEAFNGGLAYKVEKVESAMVERLQFMIFQSAFIQWDPKYPRCRVLGPSSDNPQSYGPYPCELDWYDNPFEAIDAAMACFEV